MANSTKSIADIVERIYDNMEGSRGSIDWNVLLTKENLYPVKYLVYADKSWTETQKWCQDTFGSKHYTWTGSYFWFETSEDAMMFALRWA